MRRTSKDGSKFSIGAGVRRAVTGGPYERKGRDPLFRPLKIFTLDPSASKLDGAVSVLSIPYESLVCGITAKTKPAQSEAMISGHGREKTQREFIEDAPENLSSNREGRLLPCAHALARLHETGCKPASAK